MQDLHLVGFTTDRRGLIFGTRAGARSGGFVVPITDELLTVLGELLGDDERAAALDVDRSDDAARAGDQADTDVDADEPDDRVESRLSVREIQSRIRAGEAIDHIADAAGVTEEWVERFAPPVRAEQRRIVERALDAHLERSRQGASALPLRRAVGVAMAERGVAFTVAGFEAAWSSRLVGSDRWVIDFDYVQRGRSRRASWDFDAETSTLTTSDRTASQLGFVDGVDRPPAPSAGDAVDGVIGDPGARPIDAGRGDDAGSPAPAGRSRRTGTARRRSSSATTKARATKKRSTKQTATNKKATKKKATRKTATKKAGSRKRTPTKKTATKKTATKKTASKKAGSKKRTPTKKTAKSTPRKKAPARKASVKKKVTRKQASTRTPAKKASATKPATKAAPEHGMPAERGVELVEPSTVSPQQPPSTPPEPASDARRSTAPVEPVADEAGTDGPAAAPSGNGRPGIAPPGPGVGADRGLRVRARRAGEAVGSAGETAPGPPPPPTPSPTERPAGLPDAAERVEARRARAAQRTSPPVQFRSGASAPVRTDGARPRPEPSESGDDGVDATGAARPRRRRQLRAK